MSCEELNLAVVAQQGKAAGIGLQYKHLLRHQFDLCWSCRTAPLLNYFFPDTRNECCDYFLPSLALRLKQGGRFLRRYLCVAVESSVQSVNPRILVSSLSQASVGVLVPSRAAVVMQVPVQPLLCRVATGASSAPPPAQAQWCGRQGPGFSDLIGQNVKILIFIPSSCPTLAGTEFAGLMPLTCVGFTTFMWPFRSSDLLPFNSLQLPSGLGTVLPLSEQASQSCPTHSWFSGFQRDGYKENHLGKFQAAVTKPISTEGRLITQLINPTDVTLNACFFVILLHTSCWLNRLHGPRSECQHGLQELQVGPGVSPSLPGVPVGEPSPEEPSLDCAANQRHSKTKTL